MKLAMNNSGELIKASANAPEKALCPDCKGIVILRVRRRSNRAGDVTYFWRHENYSNPRCRARIRYDIVR
jgi:hypothetical protein